MMISNAGSRRAGALAALLAAALLAACGDDQKTSGPAEAQQAVPAVTVTPVVSKPISAAFEFVGQTEAFQTVDLRARVTGFLLEQPFEEGAVVEKGKLLYVIDPSEFDAKRASAAAKVERVKATIEEAERQLQRYSVLVERGTASEAKLDEAKATEGEARADLAAAEADLDQAELDVGYTKIASPIKGKIGKSVVDVGNLIGPDSGVLATVVAQDPIRVTFSVSEREYLNYQKAIKEGRAAGVTPRIELADGEIYGHDGKLDFIDNRVDPETGTIKIRLLFPNPDTLLLPGQFVNVTLISKEPESQLVVPQAAVQENQAGPFVLVVDKENRVATRAVKTGQRTGTDIVVSDGISEGETVIVEGVQKVRPGAKVKPVQAKTS